MNARTQTVAGVKGVEYKVVVVIMEVQAKGEPVNRLSFSLSSLSLGAGNRRGAAALAALCHRLAAGPPSAGGQRDVDPTASDTSSSAWGISVMEHSDLQWPGHQSQMRAGGGFKLSGNATPRPKLAAQLPPLLSQQSAHAKVEPRFMRELIARARDMDGNSQLQGVASTSASVPVAHRIDIDLSQVMGLGERAERFSHHSQGASLTSRASSSRSSRARASEPAQDACPSRSLLASYGQAQADGSDEMRRHVERGNGVAGLELVGAIPQPAQRPKPGVKDIVHTSSKKPATPRRSLFDPLPRTSDLRIYDGGSPRQFHTSSAPPKIEASPVPFPSRRHARHLAELAKPPGQVGFARPELAPPCGRDESAYSHVSTR